MPLVEYKGKTSLVLVINLQVRASDTKEICSNTLIFVIKNGQNYFRQSSVDPVLVMYRSRVVKVTIFDFHL